MSDPFYPTIETAVLEAFITSSPKIIPQSRIAVGDTIVFILDNSAAMHKRFILIREFSPNEICFEIATGVASKLGFLGKLLNWYEQNKNWKDGGYFV